MYEKTGQIKISNEQDRLTVASILIKNGYTVCIQKEKSGSKNEYYVVYSKAKGGIDL